MTAARAASNMGATRDMTDLITAQALENINKNLHGISGSIGRLEAGQTANGGWIKEVSAKVDTMSVNGCAKGAANEDRIEKIERKNGNGNGNGNKKGLVITLSSATVGGGAVALLIKAAAEWLAQTGGTP